MNTIPRLASALIHFLWQGALIAVIYAVVRNTIGRSRSAQFRYLLACAALAAMVLAPVMSFAIFEAPAITVAQSTTFVPGGFVPSGVSPESPWLAPVARTAAEATHIAATTWIVLVWFAGAIVFWTRLFAGWILVARMRSMLVRPAPPAWQLTLNRLRAALRLSRPVQLMVSAAVQVPNVVGWLRPVILLPAGVLTGLDPELLEALLAHELAHIRRHDYLINILQSIAETTLFYHPAVWWISRHIREEREQCCDDIAVAVCGDPLTYVRALTELETCRQDHMIPALAANGGSLSARIARLLGLPHKEPRSIMDPAIAGVLLAAVVCGLYAQSAPPPKPAASSANLEFEAATLKPLIVDATTRFYPGARGGPGTSDTGRITYENPLKRLLMTAYGVGNDFISGPAWIDEERYVITATIPPSATKEQVNQMLRNLLEQRLQIKTHRETRDVPLYELTVAGKGPQLKPFVEGSYDGPAFGRAVPGGSDYPLQYASDGIDHAIGRKSTIAQIINFLSFELKRPVVDKTGLTGLYDYSLDFMPLLSGVELTDAQKSAPDLTTAVREQLGLKLTSKKGPIEVIVIDHAEKTPIEN